MIIKPPPLPATDLSKISGFPWLSAWALSTWRRTRPSARTFSTWRRARPSARTFSRPDRFNFTSNSTSILRPIRHLNFTSNSTSILRPIRPQFYVQFDLNFTSNSTSILRPIRSHWDNFFLPTVRGWGDMKLPLPTISHFWSKMKSIWTRN